MSLSLSSLQKFLEVRVCGEQDLTKMAYINGSPVWNICSGAMTERDGAIPAAHTVHCGRQHMLI